MIPLIKKTIFNYILAKYIFNYPGIRGNSKIYFDI